MSSITSFMKLVSLEGMNEAGGHSTVCTAQKEAQKSSKNLSNHTHFQRTPATLSLVYSKRVW